jgi:uncharacterized membrane protein YfcA
MGEFKSASSLAAPGIFRQRRMRIWCWTISGLLLLVGLKAVFPDWRFIPDLPGDQLPASFLLLFLSAHLCEYVDSSLGMGYGTTLTPILLLVGYEPLQVVPCILLSELVTGLSAGVMHQRDGNVDFVKDRHARNTAILLSGLSLAGATGAVVLSVNVSKALLNSIIAAIILAAGLAILASARRRFRYRPGFILLLGAVAAFNKGVSGGGYGPLTTSGQVVSGLSPKQAVAITSLAESFTCLVGLTGYLLVQGALDPSLALPLTLGGVLSVPMSTWTVRRVSERAMKVGVGCATLLLGMFLLARTL